MGSWLGQVFNLLAGGQYTSSPTPIVPGSSGPLLCDAQGRLIVCLNVPNGPVVNGAGQITWYSSAAFSITGVVKAAAGTLHQLLLQNDISGTVNLQIFDKATAPIAGDVPKISRRLTSGVSNDLAFPLGMPFLNGIAFGVSSTSNSFTAAASGAWVNAQYS